MLKFAIIGAGAGGQSMAAILTSQGHSAKLYDIDKEKIRLLKERGTIRVSGVNDFAGFMQEAFDDIKLFSHGGSGL